MCTDMSLKDKKKYDMGRYLYSKTMTFFILAIYYKTMQEMVRQYK